MYQYCQQRDIGEGQQRGVGFEVETPERELILPILQELKRHLQLPVLPMVPHRQMK